MLFLTIPYYQQNISSKGKNNAKTKQNNDSTNVKYYCKVLNSNTINAIIYVKLGTTGKRRENKAIIAIKINIKQKH